MQFESELEKYTTMGLTGGFEIKGEEKKHWLGDYRERIVFALLEEQVMKKEALTILKEKVTDKRIDKLVIRNDIPEMIRDKMMDIAKMADITYKEIEKDDTAGPIALTLASKEAVEVDNVIMDNMPNLPEKFKRSKNKYLCEEHMEELKKEAPYFVNEFKEVNFFDKLTGEKCGVCELKNNGIMM
ncbi:DUF1694 domain-containing protein [Anaeromicrobium sediminis]|uniref:DUF1694 domain-containing protein n=1 Tax=Anaeromicrobium sediminis TaxID=1478221 RepID=A0A267MFP7_9FIRM|nr:DUF1694 domain-containing protein [Anaeromicrobium sediminis]PAB58287.1 hypothetical protein CCE28_15945 [Anaeromicrobium sediminis]